MAKIVSHRRKYTFQHLKAGKVQHIGSPEQQESAAVGCVTDPAVQVAMLAVFRRKQERRKGH